MNWRELCNELVGCKRCSLASERTHDLPIINSKVKSPFHIGDIPQDVDILVVGQAPGRVEAERQEPFVGPAGQVLRKVLSYVTYKVLGYHDLNIIYTNVCLCFPKGDQLPFEEEATTCFRYVKKQIELIKPKLILATGSLSTKYLNGISYNDTSFRMGQWSGTETMYQSIPVINIYHPSYILRKSRNGGIPKELKIHYEETVSKTIQKVC